MKNLFPIVAVCIHTKKSFIIHTIDFENETVFNRIAQNGDGHSYDFSDIYIMESKSDSIIDLLMNSEINYENYDLINGEENIYDNEYHEISDEQRKEEIRLAENKKRETELHNNHIHQKILSLERQLR